MRAALPLGALGAPQTAAFGGSTLQTSVTASDSVCPSVAIRSGMSVHCDITSTGRLHYQGSHQAQC
jgi:hypothetical protein